MEREPVNKAKDQTTWRFIRNVLIKTAILFVGINLLFALVQPMNWLGNISAYNVLFPGRERFPFGEDPQHAYNLSLYNFNAMFASHSLNGGQDPDVFRIFVIGDSSVWGTLLEPQDTISGFINQADALTCDRRRVRAYNLGYPTLSLFKDIVILEQAMHYQPDLILWLVTLESFVQENQLSSPIIANNAGISEALLDRYGLSPERGVFAREENLFSKTIIGQRRNLADLARLQAYGVMWSATGIDQVYPENYPQAQRDFEADDSFHGLTSEDSLQGELAFDVLQAGLDIAGDVPVWLVNEPILISEGEHSEIRYNFFYPRWAYDQYREIMADFVDESNILYLDAWDLIPQDEFTNSAIHMTADGSGALAAEILAALEAGDLCSEGDQP